MERPRKKEEPGGPSWELSLTPPPPPRPAPPAPAPPEARRALHLGGPSPAVSRSHDDASEQGDADDGKDVVDHLGRQAGPVSTPQRDPRKARLRPARAACQQGPPAAGTAGPPGNTGAPRHLRQGEAGGEGPPWGAPR